MVGNPNAKRWALLNLILQDNVINFNFPCKPKLFVHRVGRVARAGRTGTAFSLVSGDEVAYFIDLQLFLGNSVNLVPKKSKFSDSESEWHNVLGSVGQNIYDEYSDLVNGWHERSQELSDTRRVASNGYKMYLKSRTGASVESVKRARQMKAETIGVHPMLLGNSGEETALASEKADFLEQMKNFRPANTIFETGNTSNSAKMRSMMVTKRSFHGDAIGRFRHKVGASEDLDEDVPKTEYDTQPEGKKMRLEESSQEDLVSAFPGRIVMPKAPKAARVFENKRQKKLKTKKDTDNYIGYEASDAHTEAGYSLMNNFEAAAKGAVLDIAGDDDASARAKKNQMRWDAKKKKYVRADANDKKKIKTESGVWIPASYKSNRYAKWKERSKLAQMQDEEAPGAHEDGDGGDSAEISKRRGQLTGLPRRHPAMVKASLSKKNRRDGEIKRPEQILKARREQDKKRHKNARKTKKGGRGRGKGKA